MSQNPHNPYSFMSTIPATILFARGYSAAHAHDETGSRIPRFRLWISPEPLNFLNAGQGKPRRCERDWSRSWERGWHECKLFICCSHFCGSKEFEHHHGHFLHRPAVFQVKNVTVNVIKNSGTSRCQHPLDLGIVIQSEF